MNVNIVKVSTMIRGTEVHKTWKWYDRSPRILLLGWCYWSNGDLQSL